MLVRLASRRDISYRRYLAGKGAHMKLVTYLWGSHVSIGAVDERGVIDLSDAGPADKPPTPTPAI